MKIQCDVCNEQEASVFCPADEAALCNNCDNRVHDANKLAGKHTRFSLLHPLLKEHPRCDICQERRAFLFCQEDRAILCRECDIPIHRANELTQKHKRFLLTGLKLSSSSSASASSIDSEIKCSISDQLCSPSLTDNKAILASSTSTRIRADDAHCGRQLESSVMSASSISEYLMETLPGWRVDDFLDPSCSPHGFYKACDPELPLSDRGFGSELYAILGDSAIWVPQAQAPTGIRSKETQNGVKIGMKWSEVSHTSPSLKKSRQFW